MTNFTDLKDLVNKVNNTGYAQINKTIINSEPNNDREVSFHYEVPESKVAKDYVSGNFSKDEFLDDQDEFLEEGYFNSSNANNNISNKLQIDNLLTKEMKTTPEFHSAKTNTDKIKVVKAPGGGTKSVSKVPITLRDINERKEIQEDFSSLDLTDNVNYQCANDLVEDQIDDLLDEMACMSFEQLESLSDTEREIFEMYYAVYPNSTERKASVKFCRYKKLTDPNLMNNPAIKSASTEFKKLALKLVKGSEFEASLKDTIAVSTDISRNEKILKKIKYDTAIIQPIQTVTGLQIHPYRIKLKNKQSNWSTVNSTQIFEGDIVTLDTGLILDKDINENTLEIQPIGVLDGESIKFSITDSRLIISFKAKNQIVLRKEDNVFDISIR